jgi:hypothetical protein
VLVVKKCGEYIKALKQAQILTQLYLQYKRKLFPEVKEIN